MSVLDRFLLEERVVARDVAAVAVVDPLSGRKLDLLLHWQDPLYLSIACREKSL
jgi:hypothetical protein